MVGLGRAFLLFAVVGVAASSCPDGFVSPTSTADACFHVSPMTATYVQCEDYCEEKGGTLASIRDEAENDFVRDFLGEKTAVYIGMFEAGEDESGDWQWVDGHAPTYQKWNPGDPNEWCTDEDCVVFSPGLFHDWVGAGVPRRRSRARGRGNAVAR